MTVSPEGELSWTPPDDAGGEAGVVVRISDQTGQETVESFALNVK